MIDQNCQAYSDLASPFRASADFAASALTQVFPGVPPHALLRAVAPLCELVVCAGLCHRRPAFGIESIVIRHGSRKVHEATGPRSAPSYAGPIDTRLNSTEVNRLAARHSIDWFERNMIGVAPLRYAGILRHIYSGFVHLVAFMSMNLGRHLEAHRPVVPSHQWRTRKSGCDNQILRRYLAVMDPPSKFYLETVSAIFSSTRCRWPSSPGAVGGYHPRAITKAALFTVDGERDDICAVGQTLKAQELCSSLTRFLKRHYVYPGVGHYGVFNGQRCKASIYLILTKHHLCERLSCTAARRASYFLRNRFALTFARVCQGASNEPIEARPPLAVKVNPDNTAASAFSRNIRWYSLGEHFCCAISRVRRSIVSQDAKVKLVIMAGIDLLLRRWRRPMAIVLLRWWMQLEHAPMRQVPIRPLPAA